MPRTDSTIPGITILDNDSNGYVVSCLSAGAFLTTASKFAVGCILTNTNTGKLYYNSGTVAVPSWNEIGAITNAEIDPLLVQTVQVSLTAAQINGMSATPVEIITAVTGKAIILDDMVFDLTGTATQFAGGGVVNLQYKATATGAGTTLHADIAATVVTGATARTVTQRIAKDLSSTATADITAIGVYISNKTAAFTTGTGTAVVTARYHLI
jgi:hypothetical protein